VKSVYSHPFLKGCLGIIQTFLSVWLFSGEITKSYSVCMFLPPVTRAMISLPAKLYELGVRARIALYESNILESRRLNAPVISVGNLTVGGTGKTPCVAFLARFLRDEGQAVAILSRGYKRESRGRVVVSNGGEILCAPSESGDEPFLLAK